MIKVKYIRKNIKSKNCTYPKIYDVVPTRQLNIYDNEETIFIIDDNGEITEYYFEGFFEDATTEYRNNIIDNVLL